MLDVMPMSLRLGTGAITNAGERVSRQLLFRGPATIDDERRPGHQRCRIAGEE